MMLTGIWDCKTDKSLLFIPTNPFIGVCWERAGAGVNQMFESVLNILSLYTVLT